MEWWQLLLGGGVLVGLAALLTALATRKRDKDTDLDARFTANMALNTYLDQKIEAATKPLALKIATLEKQLEGFRSRDEAVKSILRSFFQRLQWWDRTGRDGPMPMPSAEDIATLDLDLDLDVPKIDDWRMS